MDELDRKLIEALQNNSRQSYTQLAKAVGVVKSTARRRLEKLISSGDIIPTALPNLEKFGYSIHTLIGLQVDRQKITEIAEQLCHCSSIRMLNTCTGFSDIFFRADFKSKEDLTDFISDYLGKLNGIAKINTMLEYKEIKRTHNRIEFSSRNRMKTLRKDDFIITDADRQLIVKLQKNSRIPLKELAKDMQMSESTIHRRIKVLVNSGAIELTAVPNFTKIGYTVTCIIGIEVELSKIHDVAESLSRYSNVNYVGLYSGPMPIIVGADAFSDTMISNFVSNELLKIAGITRVSTLVSLNVLKRTFTWLPE